MVSSVVAGTVSDVTAATRKKASRRRKILRWTKIVALAFALSFAAGLIAIAIVIRRIEAGLPSVAELRSPHRCFPCR